MIPSLIVKRARDLGLGLIAITDHNSVENVEAVQRAAHGSGVTVLPGMELQTQEEAHVLCLFDTVEQACQRAMEGADGDDAILVTGSLYTAGAARPILQRHAN